MGILSRVVCFYPLLKSLSMLAITVIFILNEVYPCGITT